MLHRRVQVRGAEVVLTPTEYRILTTLVQHAGKVVTQQQLLQNVWGPSHSDHSHYIRVYMGHLRHKLEAEPARPRNLLTESIRYSELMEGRLGDPVLRGVV